MLFRSPNLRAVANGVMHISCVRVVPEIADIVVLRIAIGMTRHHAVRSRANEREHYENVHTSTYASPVIIG
jgi:hypothetical protein